MANNVSSPPEPFSLAPLVTLLPQRGTLSRLESLVPSLFARYESVEDLRVSATDRDIERGYGIESSMLRTILDWFSVKPGGNE